MPEIELEGLRTASLSDVGRMRERNEDACAEFVEPSGRRLLVVADGMGGHRAGDRASREAIQAIGEVFRTTKEAGDLLLEHAFQAANARIYGLAAEDLRLAGMGTTAVALLFGRDASFVGHVGDSRAYRLRGGRLEALTSDHSVVAEMERRGIVTAAEAAVHPRRNELLRSIGVEPIMDVDLKRVSVEKGDRYLLCTDGLCGVVPEPEIARLLAGEDPETGVRALVDRANALGGPDNVTVQIAVVPD